MVVTAYASLILGKPAVTAKVWMRLLGLLASLIGMVPLCRLHYRPLYHPLSLMVPVPPKISSQIFAGGLCHTM